MYRITLFFLVKLIWPFGGYRYGIHGCERCIDELDVQNNTEFVLHNDNQLLLVILCLQRNNADYTSVHTIHMWLHALRISTHLPTFEMVKWELQMLRKEITQVQMRGSVGGAIWGSLKHFQMSVITIKRKWLCCQQVLCLPAC